jgi:hypothetical protein
MMLAAAGRRVAASFTATIGFSHRPFNYFNTFTAAGVNVRHFSSKKQTSAAATTTTMVRLLVDSRHHVAITGARDRFARDMSKKTGTTINMLRANGTDTENDMGNAGGNVPQRILEIRGARDDIALAVEMVATRLLKASKETPLMTGVVAEEATATVMLLVHSEAVTGLSLGNETSAKRDLEESTGAQLQVSSKALAFSTENSVCMRGPPTAIRAATQAVLEQLAAFQLPLGARSVAYVPMSPQQEQTLYHQRVIDSAAYGAALSAGVGGGGVGGGGIGGGWLVAAAADDAADALAATSSAGIGSGIGDGGGIGGGISDDLAYGGVFSPAVLNDDAAATEHVDDTNSRGGDDNVAAPDAAAMQSVSLTAPEELEALAARQLRAGLKCYGLPFTGKKATLIARLAAHANDGWAGDEASLVLLSFVVPNNAVGSVDSDIIRLRAGKLYKSIFRHHLCLPMRLRNSRSILL